MHRSPLAALGFPTVFKPTPGPPDSNTNISTHVNATRITRATVLQCHRTSSAIRLIPCSRSAKRRDLGKTQRSRCAAGHGCAEPKQSVTALAAQNINVALSDHLCSAVTTHRICKHDARIEHKSATCSATAAALVSTTRRRDNMLVSSLATPCETSLDELQTQFCSPCRVVV